MLKTLSAFQKAFIKVLPWLTLIIAQLFYFQQYVLRVSVSSIAPELARNFHIQAVTLATVTASFYYAFILFKLPAGLLLDRFGSRFIITIATFLCAAGSFLFTFSDKVIWIEIGRALIGIGASFSFVGVIVLAKRWFSENHFVYINNFTLFLGTIGGIIGVGSIVSSAQDEGWRFVMFVLSSITFIIMLLSWLIIRDPVQIIDQQKAVGERFLYSFKESLKKTFSSRPTWIGGIYLALMFMPMTSFFVLWSKPYYATLYKKTDFFTTYSTSFALIGLAIGFLFFSFVKNYFKFIKRIIQITTAIYFIAQNLYLFSSIPKLWMAVCLLFAGFTLGATGLIYVYVADNTGEDYRGTAVSLASLLQTTGGAIALPVIGKILDSGWKGDIVHHIDVFPLHDYHVAFILLSVSAFIALLISFLIKE